MEKAFPSTWQFMFLYFPFPFFLIFPILFSYVIFPFFFFGFGFSFPTGKAQNRAADRATHNDFISCLSVLRQPIQYYLFLPKKGKRKSFTWINRTGRRPLLLAWGRMSSSNTLVTKATLPFLEQPNHVPPATSSFPPNSPHLPAISSLVALFNKHP